MLEAYGFIWYCAVSLGFALIEATTKNTHCCIWLLVALVAFSEGMVKVEYHRVLEFAVAVLLPFGSLEAKLCIAAFLALRAFEESEVSTFSFPFIEFRVSGSSLAFIKASERAFNLKPLLIVESISDLILLIRSDRQEAARSFFASNQTGQMLSLPLTSGAWVRIERRLGSRLRREPGVELWRVTDVTETVESSDSKKLQLLENLNAVIFDASTVLDDKLRIVNCNAKLKDALGSTQSLTGVPLEAFIQDKLRLRAHAHICSQSPLSVLPIKLNLDAGGEIKLYLSCDPNNSSVMHESEPFNVKYHAWLRVMHSTAANDDDSSVSPSLRSSGYRRVAAIAGTRKLLPSVSEAHESVACCPVIRDVIQTVARTCTPGDDLLISFDFLIYDDELHLSESKDLRLRLAEALKRRDLRAVQQEPVDLAVFLSALTLAGADGFVCDDSELNWLRSHFKVVLSEKVAKGAIFEYLCNQWAVFCARRGLLKEAETVLMEARGGPLANSPTRVRLATAISGNLALVRLQLGDREGANDEAEQLEDLLGQAQEMDITVHPGCAKILAFCYQADE